MIIERFEEDNRIRVDFTTMGGQRIQGEVIEKVTHQRGSPHVTVTVRTKNGDQAFTFLSEQAWLKAIGAQTLF